MTTKWWITRAGDCLNVPEGGVFLDCVAANPSFFGVEGHEVEFARGRGTDGELALIDKLCYDIETPDGEVQIPGAMMIEQTDRGLHIRMWRESYAAYERIMEWLSSRPFLANTKVILEEVGTTRKWGTSVGVLLSNPFAKNPDRRGNCPRCNQQISWGEIVERGVCPKCGQKLT